MVRRAFIACLLAVATLAAAQGPDAKALRVLFIGNSLTYTGDIPERFSKLATAMGRKATVETVAFPDFSLEDHWRDGREAGPLHGLAVRRPDARFRRRDRRVPRGRERGGRHPAAGGRSVVASPLGRQAAATLQRDTIHPASLGGDLAVLTIYLTLFPAGPQEFDEALVARVARSLGIPAERRDLLFDAATRAIDQPMALK